MNKKVIQKVVVTARDQGTRLDLFAVIAFGITRSQVQKMLAEGNILINGSVQKSRYSIQENDVIELIEQKSGLAPDVPVLYEDDYMLVINKPSGISAHKSPGDKDITVAEIFRDRLRFPKDEVRPGIVHRLDKGTSGIMVVAKDQETLLNLQKEFKNRNIRKKYVALIEGVIIPKSGVINIPILRDASKRERMTIAKDGKEAITEYQTLQDYKHYALLELYPKTGRTHQIRVHLSALGYPIVSDRKYGHKSSNLERIFLHAREITFRHPKSEKLVTFEAPLPTDLQNYLDVLTRK